MTSASRPKAMRVRADMMTRYNSTDWHYSSEVGPGRTSDLATLLLRELSSLKIARENIYSRVVQKICDHNEAFVSI